jgi:hypothetical protein
MKSKLEWDFIKKHGDGIYFIDNKGGLFIGNPSEIALKIHGVYIVAKLKIKKKS